MAMRAISMLFCAAVLALAAAPASAQFAGELAFTPDACRAKRSCILKYPLSFTDPNRRVWEAKAGGITDGASIPDWAQGVIGGRWDESFLKAAVLHDHYCGAMTYSWKETHRMFYDALVALGVGAVKAKIMYYAVYVGGPKWEVAAAAGTPACDPAKGENCLMSIDPGGAAMVVRPARFGEMDMTAEIREATSMTAREPDVTLDELEEMARRAHPADGFLRRDGAASQR